MSVSKERIKTLRSILETENFYPFLCAFSNNDIETVIDNLAKVINYVLSSNIDFTNIDYKTIIEEGVNYRRNNEYLIYSTNSYLDNITKLTGIRPAARKRGIMKDLTTLDHQMSFFTFSHSTYFPIYGTIKQALEEGFSHPKTLYEGILKQPETDKRPAIVGESEQKYYRSILEKRLKNVPDTYARTGTRVAKKILREIIGKDISLYFLPERYIEEEEITEDNPVSPLELRRINIPSKYTLLMMCARNKRLAEGTKIRIDDGGKYEKKVPVQKQYSSLEWHRYEAVCISDSFIYNNEELSGDTEYDLDELYGKHDNKNGREIVSSLSLSDKIARIKNSYDINLTKRDGKYRIQNGRHRLLFLKNYYLTTSPGYTNPEHLRRLKEMVTVYALVDHTFEDPEINYYLIELEKMFKNIHFLKTDIETDEFGILVFLGGRVHLLKAKEDLIKFYNLVVKGKLPDEYFIGINTQFEQVPSDIVIAKLIVDLRSAFFNLNLADIIVYLKTQHVEIAGMEVKADKLNFLALYTSYTVVHNAFELERLRKEPTQVYNKAQEKLSFFEELSKQRKR